MSHNLRSLVNGARLVPQGFKLDVSFLKFEDANAYAIKRNKEAIAQKTGYTYNATGVSGNYKILCYTGDKVQSRYASMT